MPDEVERFDIIEDPDKGKPWSVRRPNPLGGGWVSYSDYEKLDESYQRMKRARSEALRERDEARYSPMGDNHHNAVACPYCRPDREAEQKKLRQQRDEELRERLEALLQTKPSWIEMLSPVTRLAWGNGVRDALDAIFEEADGA